MRRDGITDIRGSRTPGRGEDARPTRMDENTSETPDRWVQSACVLCSNSRRMDIGVKDERPGGRIVGVRGGDVDRVNRGHLGPKGLDAWAADGDADRSNRARSSCPSVMAAGRARPPPRRQRVDLVRVGPGEQAAPLRVRRREHRKGRVARRREGHRGASGRDGGRRGERRRRRARLRVAQAPTRPTTSVCCVTAGAC